MGSEPMANQVPTVSAGFSEPGLDHADAANSASEGAVCAARSAPTNADHGGDEAWRLCVDDEVTAVVPRGFPGRFYGHRHAWLRAMTLVGIAALGFVGMGIANAVKARHRVSPNVVTVRAPTPPAKVADKPAATADGPSVAKLGGEAPILAAVLPPPVRNKTDLALCQAALTKRRTTAIERSCEHALEADPSLATPILAWAMRELDRGNLPLAAAWARRVLDADDELADAYLIVGLAEQEARHVSTAKSAYRRYLELAPRGRYAHDVRSSMVAL